MDRPGLLSSTEAREAKRLTQLNAQIFSERLICVFNEGSSSAVSLSVQLTWCSAVSGFAAATVLLLTPASRHLQLLPPRHGQLLQLLPPRHAGRCCRHGGVRETTVAGRTDRCRPGSSAIRLSACCSRRAHTPPCVTFCRAQHSSKILRIFTEIFKNFPTHICTNKEQTQLLCCGEG